MKSWQTLLAVGLVAAVLAVPLIGIAAPGWGFMGGGRPPAGFGPGWAQQGQADGQAPAWGPGSRRGGMMGRFGGPMGGGPGFGAAQHEAVLAEAAKALGMEVADLTVALQAGRGVADLAKEKGTTLEKVLEAANAPHAAFLAEQVTAGRLTQEQADQLAKLHAARGLMGIYGAALGGGPPWQTR